MLKITLRELCLVVLVVALALGWFSTTGECVPSIN
jgi:hypothetical protein